MADKLTLADFDDEQEPQTGLTLADFEDPDPTSYYPQAAGQVAAPVIRTLSWLSAPQEAAQRGAKALFEGRYGDIGSDALSGLKLEGGDTATWGDSFLSPRWQALNPIYQGMRGVGSGTIGGVEIDPAELFRAGMVGAGELFLDPLAAVGMLGDVPRVVEAGAKAADWVAGTKLGRALGANPSELNYGKLNRLASRVEPTSQYQQQRIAEEISGQQAAARAYHGDEGIASDDMWTALERPGSRERQAYLGEVQQADKLRKLNRKYLTQINTLRRDLGLPERGTIDSDELYDWWPRNLDVPESTRRGGRSGGPVSSGGREAATQRSRELFRWVDEAGETVTNGKVGSNSVPVRGRRTPVRVEDVPHAKELVAQKQVSPAAQDRILQLTDENGETAFYHLGTGKRVQKQQLTKPEAQRLTGEKRVFKSDPYAAMMEDFSRKVGELTYLKFAKRGLDDGWLRHVDEELPEGYQALDIPGLQHLAAPKPAVGRIERVAKAMLNPESFTDALEEGARIVGRSKFGEFAKAFRHKWASWQLGAFPRFHLGNEISNDFLLYTAGVPAVQIPKFKAQAALLQFDSRAPQTAAKLAKRLTPKGNKTDWTPQQFRAFMEKAGALTTWSKAEQQADLLGYRQSPGLSDLMDEQISRLDDTRLNRVAQGARGITASLRKMGEAGDAVTEAGFKYAGEPIENNARLAAALWHIDTHVPAGQQPSVEDLKEAAYFAQKALFNYQDLSSFERGIKTIAPYWAFHRNMIRRYFKDYATQPHKLGRMERAGEMVFQTPTEGELYDAPPYLRESAAVTGIGPWSLGAGEQGPRVALLGRFNPYVIGDQLMGGMGGIGKYAAGLLGPYGGKAALEMAFNEQIHSGYPVDRIVEQTPETVSGLSRMEQGLAGPLMGIPTESREELFGLRVPNYWRFMSDIMPTASFVREADKYVEALGDVTGNEFLRDQSRNPMPPWYHVSKLLGINTYEPKWSSYEYYGEKAERDYVRDLEGAARRAEEDGAIERAQELYQQAERMAELMEKNRARAKQHGAVNSTTP